jgi:hypothetical protein
LVAILTEYGWTVGQATSSDEDIRDIENLETHQNYGHLSSLVKIIEHKNISGIEVKVLPANTLVSKR